MSERDIFDSTPDEGEIIDLAYLLEEETLELANIALENRTAEIVVEGFDPLIQRLDRKFIDYFETLRNPAETIKSVDLRINYDKQAKQFKPESAVIAVANGTFITIMPGRRSDDNRRFFMQIVDSTGMPLPVPQSSDIEIIYDSAGFTDLLRSFNIGLPNQSQPADWGEIERILQFSKRWRMLTETFVALSPSEQILIRDQINGGMKDSHPGDAVALDFSANEVWQRTITIGLESAKKDSLYADGSVQLQLITKDKYKPPRIDINSASYVPLRHDEVAISVLQNDELVEKQIFERIEEDGQPISLSFDLLRRFREGVLAVRTALSEKK